MSEKIDLTVAEIAPATSTYEIETLTLDVRGARIYIVLWCAATGKQKTHEYRDTTATQIMRALNTADLSVKSLQRRILERLIADGVLAGNVTGSPD